MKKHIADILSNENIATYIMNFKRSYIESPWFNKIKDLAIQSSREKRFILLATEWIFEDQEGKCWGVLGEHVIFLQKDLECQYACEYFEGIYEYYKNKSPEVIEKNRNKAKSQGINYEQIALEYYMCLDDNNIVPSFLEEPEKFQNYVKKNK